MLGYQEIIIILVIALLVFGPAKLPEIGRQVGSALRELRKMSSDMQRALDLEDHGNSYDRYDYDRDKRSIDRYAPDNYSGDSSFEYSSPEGQTYAQGSLDGSSDLSAAAALPAPPGPPSVVGRSDVSHGESMPGAMTDDVPSYPSYEATAAGDNDIYHYAAENGAAADTPAGGETDAGTRVAATPSSGQGHKES